MAVYHPEPYWNTVAKRISYRDKFDLIEGEREPYYRYKRKKVIKLFDKIDFQDKIVLEVGSGPVRIYLRSQSIIQRSYTESIFPAK